ncbi:DUF2298 domain-containing protein [Chloroflexus sp.]|uniref:DUF2298 domain-containing protein n=1 Tax=Chloroflexus sp. TaxID=1904827 RepID=UPI00298EEFF7|nr:DUF2298 domain-containing protein [Chloroflexus sp.]MDW8402837.1 DUF2298 domain-containing protein [Chloroflexus sp.]
MSAVAGGILVWWVIALLFALSGWPAASRIFGHLPGAGAAFARPLGLLLTGFLAWLLAMLGLGRFETPLIVICLAIIAGSGWIWLWRSGQRRLPPLGPALAGEAIFLATLLGVVWLRAHDPAPWGTERPMDFAFFNAIQRSGFFPPNDPWLSGYSINYYYFGYLLMAIPAMLSGLPPATAYNLALALLAAMTAHGAFGLINALLSLLRHPPPALIRGALGVLGAVIILLAGNQSGAIQVIVGTERAVALDERQLLSALEQALRGEAFITLPYPANTSDFGAIEGWQREDTWRDFNWWWPSRSLWDSYRVAGNPPRSERRYAITEFPFFSFRLGDMHPHVMALPFATLAIGLALAVAAQGCYPTPTASVNSERSEVALFPAGWAGWLTRGLHGIILGSLYAINSWDLPTYLLLYWGGLALACRRNGAAFPWRAWLREAVIMAFLAFALFLPFHLTFRAPVGGATPWIDLPILSRLTSIIGIYLGERSGWHEFVIIFGLMALPIIAGSYLYRSPADELLAGSAMPRWLPWLPLILFTGGLLIGFPLLALGGLALWAGWKAFNTTEPGLRFGLLLATLGSAILFGVEFVYIRDVFEGFSARMNTVFKFYYQVWLLWGVLAPVGLWWVWAQATGWRRLAASLISACATLLLAGGLVYPLIVIRDLGRGAFIGLNGYTPREQTAAGVASLAWLRHNIPAGSVVLEAAAVENDAAVAAGSETPRCGGSYNWQGFGGIAAASGHATVLGWVGHEMQWRGGDPAALAELGPRCLAVDAIYRSGDPAQIRTLLDRYGVDYIYVGALERERYPAASLAVLAQVGDPVFTQDEVVIYRVK